MVAAFECPCKTDANEIWQLRRIRPGAYNGTAHRPSPTELFGILRENPSFRVGDGLRAVPFASVCSVYRWFQRDSTIQTNHEFIKNPAFRLEMQDFL